MEKFNVIQISPNTWTIQSTNRVSKASNLTIIAGTKEEAIDILLKCGYEREELI